MQGGGYDQLESVPTAVPAGLDDILQALSRQEGVTGVELGRCVEEKRTVSQVGGGGRVRLGVIGGGKRPLLDARSVPRLTSPLPCPPTPHPPPLAPLPHTGPGAVDH